MARWEPLQRAVPIVPDWVKDDPEAIRHIQMREVWKNNIYTVTVFRNMDGTIIPDEQVEVICLSIKANNKSVRRDWREFQKIKNEILGPEEEAVEIYPAESRLVDTANQYFLWCMKGKRAPVGFVERLVAEGDGGIGARQRPWHREERPADLTEIPIEVMKRAVRKH